MVERSWYQEWGTAVADQTTHFGKMRKRLWKSELEKPLRAQSLMNCGSLEDNALREERRSWKPEKVLENCWSLYHNESLEILILRWAVGVHAFNSSTPREAEAGRFLSLRPAQSIE